MKLDLRTRTATLLAATGALLTGLAATAVPAHADVVVSHYIDLDDVTVAASSGKVYGRTFEALNQGYVTMSLRAITERAAAQQGCVSSRLTYIYADGTIGMQYSPRVCVKGTTNSTQVETMFRSAPTKDLVRYVVQLQTASGPTTTVTTVATSTQFIGDAPESLGTSARLDRDPLARDWTDGSSFRGVADFGITSNATSAGTTRNVTGQVSGEYTWSSQTGSGSSSRAIAVTWYYTDGTSSTTQLGQIYAGMAPRKVLATSDPRRDLVSVDAHLWGSSWGWPSVTYFGDEED